MRAVVLALALSACASTEYRPETPDEAAARAARAQLGLQLLQMSRPQPRPRVAPPQPQQIRPPVYCRTVFYGLVAQTVCD